MNDRLRKTLILTVSGLVVAGIIVLQFFAPKDLTRTIKPKGIMGTTCEITVFAKATNHNACFEGLEDIDRVLRSAEVVMSAKMEPSMLSRINAAPGGVTFDCPPHLMEVLTAARNAHLDSDGAFDVTIGPLLDLWKLAGRGDVLPSDTEIQAARDASSWADFGISGNKFTKRRTTAQLDLGGIAKGYAIDQAVEAILRYRPEGGFIDVGGDLRFFGYNPNGPDWTVKVQHPFDPDTLLGVIHVDGGAVCTSGNYARYVTIEGKRFSHIIDPRTGMPTRVSPSVTVLAPTAMQADVWATALSVLGPDALTRDDNGDMLLPDGVEAMILLGDETNFALVMTDGFAERFVATDTPEALPEEAPAE